MPADWQLPPGIPRSVWEFAADTQIPFQEHAHLAAAPLLEFDQRLVHHWFPTPGRLIDLGCGTGRSLAEFGSRGFECTGIDVSQPSLVAARERLDSRNQKATLLRANLCELDCVAGYSFDYALLLFGTLGMVRGRNERLQVLSHAARMLRTGGQLALHVHNFWPHLFIQGGRGWLVRDLWRRLWNSDDAGDTWRGYRGIPRIYHHVFSRREICRLLQRTGFHIEEIVPLRAGNLGPSATDLTAVGPLVNLRCTGWLIRAERGPAVETS